MAIATYSTSGGGSTSSSGETAAEKIARMQAAFNKQSTSTKTTSSTYIPAPSATKTYKTPTTTKTTAKTDDKKTWLATTGYDPNPSNIATHLDVPYEQWKANAPTTGPVIIDPIVPAGDVIAKRQEELEERKYTLPQFGEKPEDSGSLWLDAGGNLTKQGLAYAGHYTAQAVTMAQQTGNYDLMPNIMSIQMANELGMPLELYTQFYDENGVKRKLGDDGAGTTTYGGDSGGGWSSSSGPGGPGSSSGANIKGWRYGVIQWRI